MAGNAETAARMREAKGYAGRPKGAKNHVTNDLKKVYLQAFEKLGGLQGLVEWGEKSPDLFYGQISKLLPKGIEIKAEHELQINIITAIPEPKPLPAEYARDYIDVSPKPGGLDAPVPDTAPEDAPQSTITVKGIPKAACNKDDKCIK